MPSASPAFQAAAYSSASACRLASRESSMDSSVTASSITSPAGWQPAEAAAAAKVRKRMKHHGFNMVPPFQVGPATPLDDVGLYARPGLKSIVTHVPNAKEIAMVSL